MTRINRSSCALTLFGLLLSSACGPQDAQGPGAKDDELTALEEQLASGGDNTALCVEYLTICEQGISICLQGDNAQTYASFCTGLQGRCANTVATFCTAAHADAGPPADAGPTPDAGRPADAGVLDAGAVDAGAVGPAISDVRAYDVTASAAKITWTLSEAATGQVEYGTTTSYGQLSRAESSFSHRTHIQQLTGLAAGTLYHFRVRSTNQAGGAAMSGDFTFTTTGGVTPPPPAGCAPAPTSSRQVDVRSKGATPNDSTDDTAKIQEAIEEIGGTGGTVLIPDGTFMINALRRLTLRSNMTLRMTSGAVLKAITNGSADTYAIISVGAGVSNVNIIGGTIVGDRTTHTGEPCSPLGATCGESSVPGSTTGMLGQHGMGVMLLGASHVFVDGVTSKENWGDGFYIGGNLGGVPSTDVTLCRVVADKNRRQGLSIVSANKVVVKDSTFKNTRGQLPMAGIDVEPNPARGGLPGTTVNDVLIANNLFTGNEHGITTLQPGNATPTGFITNLTIRGNEITGNGHIGLPGRSYGIVLSYTPGVTVTENKVHNNLRTGIGVANLSKGNRITNNIVTNNGNTTDRNDFGIVLSNGSSGNTVTGNTVTGNLSTNLRDAVGGNTISSNTAP